MASWADRLAKTPDAVAEPAAAVATTEPEASYAVLDASALIGTTGSYKLADRCITTPDVYQEVRDKSSKHALASLPFGIEQREPDADSVATVTGFAKATGEVHSLSSADIRLIALAYMLHVERYGKQSLRLEAAPARPAGKGKKASQALPGWGAAGGEWAELDKLNQDELDAQEGLIAASRINAEVQEVDLGDLSLAESTTDHPDTNDLQSEETAIPEADEWVVAASSHNAARRHRKKQLKRQLRAQSSGASYNPATAQLDTQSVAQEGELNDRDTIRHTEDSAERSNSSDCDPDESSSQSEDEEHGSIGTSIAESRRISDATICISTADFAMQNVILQMGLRLVSPDGRQIRRISKWVLRCSACFKVTKEMERLFCPACGNAALQKVEVVIGQDGAEVYGVRKRHIIRGTRFSLPKPKGGKNNSDPVLREDVYMQRMPRRKPKKDSTDPFAPEFNSNTWHDQRFSNGVNSKGVAAALASWKHNPNERRHARTNRR